MAIQITTTKRGIAFRVRVESKSSRRGIAGFVGDAMKVKVHSPPVGGAANAELTEILAEAFQVRKSAIRILSGRASKDKIVEVENLRAFPSEMMHNEK